MSLDPTPSAPPDQTPPDSTPAAAPEPVSAPPDAGAAPAASPAADAAPVLPPDLPPPAPEPHVPWAEHRRLRSDLRTTKQQYDQFLEQEYKPLQERVRSFEEQQRAWEAERAKFGEVSQNYDALLSVISRDPELREQVRAAVNAPGALPPTSFQQPNGNGHVQPAQPPPVPQEIREVHQYLREAREQLAAERAAAEAQRFEGAVMNQITGFLKERQYDPNEVLSPSSKATLAQRVRDYVEIEARRVSGGRGLPEDELPHLLNQWYAEDRARMEGTLKRYATRKVGDARTAPPALPGGTAPVAITEKPLPFNDPRFLERVVQDWEGRQQGRQ